MDERRSYYVAGIEPPRPKVISAWALAISAVLVLAVLAVIFPRDRLRELLSRDTEPDFLTVSYMQNLLRTESRNLDLRLRLAEKQLALGTVADAETTLAPIKPDELTETQRNRVALARYRIAKTRGTGPDQAGADTLRETIRELAKTPLDAPTLLTLADEAAGLGMPVLSTELFVRATARAGQEDRLLLEAHAKRALGRGQYEEAAALYFGAQRVAPTRAERKAYFLKGVETLQSGDMLAQALDAADQHIGDLANDDEVLERLIRLALAANDGARAQAYARRLLRMSGRQAPGRPIALLERILAGLVPDVHAQTTDTPGGIRPYDERLYVLAFDVFVANGNLYEAYRVAKAAVAQRPEDLAWRERLARVAEWSGRPQEALEQLVYIANASGSPEAFAGIMRIAPGVGGDEALLFAWKRAAETRTLTRAEIARLAELFELVGRPAEGIAFFESMERRRPRPEWGLEMARLAERAGRLDEAIARYEAIAARDGLTRDRAVTLATLYLSRSDFRRAFDTLQQVEGRIAGADREYWQLFGDLAWRLQEEEATRRAYGRLAERNEIERFQFGRLVQLTRERQPLEAARLAELGWRRLDDPELLLLALDIYAAHRDWPSMGRLFGEIDAEAEKRLAGRAYFFVLRGNYLARQGERQRALADYRRALAITPADDAVRVTLLWFLIDTANLPELARAMRLWEKDARTNPALWPAYAAGHLALNEPRRALAYFQREIRTRSDDYLWLLGYADALEQANQGGAAWRVRRHAWHVVRAKAAADPRELAPAEKMIAYARLVTIFHPGDPSLAVVQRVLREDEPVASAPTARRRTMARPERELDAASRELALAWAISTEQRENARAWLWTQYGRRLAAPLYARISVALVEQDLDTVERLVANDLAGMPRYNQIDAARALEAARLAETLGFELSDRYRDDDELHLRFTEDATRRANGVILRQSWFDYAPVDGTATFAAVPYWVTPGLRITPFYDLVRQSSQDDSAITGVPATDRAMGLGFLARSLRRETELIAGYRDALADFPWGILEHTERVSERVTARLGLGYNQRAIDTVALLVGGVKDEARVSLFYGLSRREYVNALAATTRFRTQDRTSVGSGYRLELETGYRFRIEYPDLSVRLSAARYGYRPGGATDELAARLTPDGTVPDGTFFLPPSYNYYGVSIGFGDYLRGQPTIWQRFMDEPYSRGWRPFADVGLSHNTVTGNGWNAIAGVGGSVFGNDYLAAYFLHSDGGKGVFSEVREIVLRYQLFF